MDLWTRLEWLAVGGLIGFVIGYVVRGIREIKEEVGEVNKKITTDRNEKGFMRHPLVADVVLLLVVALVAWAAFASQNASNRSNDTSDRVIAAQASIVELQSEQKQNLDCTTQILFDAIRALNERTTYSGAQADANIALVQGQLDLLVGASNPALSDSETQAILDEYVQQVQDFIELATQTKNQQLLYPYPTVQDLTECLAKDPNDAAPTPSQGSNPSPSTGTEE